MANLYHLYQNKNTKSTTFGKYYARADYADSFVEMERVAEYIQDQCSVKTSDCLAVVRELGEAIGHFLSLGQKVKIENLGVFKPSVTSKPLEQLADWDQAKYLKQTKLLFYPEKVKLGKKQVPAFVKDVSWTMVEVGVDSNGEPVIGRKAIREAKEASGGGGD